MRKSIRTPIKKTTRSCHLLWRVVLLVSVSLLLAGTAWAGPLQLQTTFDNNTVYSEQPAPHYLEVLVIAAPATGAVKRRLPLNLALVIDTSGSMRDENKLTSVQQAAIALVNRLQPEDRLAIVSYNNEAKVVLPSSPMKMEQEARWLIQSLRADGGTNLGAGLIEGYHQLREFASPRSINRVLLLSDGKANVGITSSAELSRMALQEADAGISLSTFGVGLDFNEDLMAALSESGRGMYYFIDRPESMETILAKEFNSVESLMAADIQVTITLAPDLHIERVFANSYQVNGNTISVRFGDLSAGERRRMQVRFLPSPRSQGTANNAAKVEMSYRTPGGEGSGTLTQGIGLAYVKSPQAIAGNLDKEVAERSAVFEANFARMEAAQAYDRGEKKRAASILNTVKKKLEGLTSSSRRVQQEVTEMEEYQQGLEQAMPASKRAMMQKQVKYKGQALEGC
ncbi:MAG: VWA domain-containing protein [Candidatus Electrothrix aestuarii]|uniref:VWA domain-containing protein n=1 Tax=Candidatus Electrothrix aestuarii TaxID=3062594 RepID=A0AAU8LQZ2_9BACT|nr:VWA domain-containing protein [Candidatus Electrothrix aestuarii]